MKNANLALILVILCFFLFAFSSTKADPDLWGHLKFGQDIFSSLSVPRYDTYSYSSFGAPWINHEWLSELILYIIFKLAKSLGLVIFKLFSALSIASFIYISLSKNTKSVYLKLILMILCFSILWSGFAIRPQIFTFLLFTLLIFLLDRFENTADTRWIYCLPAIFLLWPNLHGGFITGVGFLLLYDVFKICERKFTPAPIGISVGSPQLVRGFPHGLIGITLLSLLATLVNPYGIGFYSFTIRAITMPRPLITEWQMVPLGLEYVNYFALCAIAALGFLFSKRRRSYFEASAILIAVYFSFIHKRHIVLLVILVLMYIPKYIDSFSGKWLARAENRYSQRVFIPIFAALSLYFLLAAFYSGNRLFTLVIPSQFPVNAVTFIKQNNISGNIFSNFNWAQMCIGELSPGSKVFIDGRYETVYSDSLIQGYCDVVFGKKDYKDFLAGFPETDIMFLQKGEVLAESLSKDSEWAKVYSSTVAQIFLKNNRHNKTALLNFKNHRLNYPAEKGAYIF
ncbi:MAG: hypothetical protein NTU54_06290 [Candidatus Omnitrophica bacterium]|nr:hypothetical protein [Candidatus Omnitrophota bacterium]